MEKRITRIKPSIPKLIKLENVAAYSRVSDGKETMLHSLSAQVSYYSEMIQRNPKWRYVGVYSDKAVTGTKADREGFQKMLRDCREGKIDMIITKSISRFARNTLTLLNTVRELRELGVDVYFEEQNIHTMSGDGELMLTILASFAQEESRSVSENCKWRIRIKFAEGQPTGHEMYGYDVKNGVFKIKPDEAEVVRSIFDMYLAGMGRLRIVKHLDERGIPSPDGVKWVPSVVSDILRNEKYVGDLLLQKFYVNNHIEKKKCFNRGELPQYFVQDDHEAIIDRDTFLMVQIEMAIRKEKYGHRRKKRRVTTEGLTGRIFCGQCGKGYNRKINAAGTAYAKPVWICRTYNLKGKAYCASKQIPEDILLSVANEFSEEQVERILVHQGNLLDFVLKDGTIQRRTWKDHSRQNSWSPEMKEKARQRSIEYHRERRARSDERNAENCSASN